MFNSNVKMSVLRSLKYLNFILFLFLGGETIKQINQQSGAYCELDRRSQNPNSNEKVFLIKGDPDSIETAKRIIQDKVQMPLNFVSQGGGGPPSMSASMPTVNIAF